MFDATVALEMAKLERVHGCPIWQTAKGELIPVTKMEVSHLYAAWRYMVRAAKNPKSDAQYEKAIIRLATLSEEFKLRKLSYEQNQLDELVKENSRKYRSFYDLDRDLDEGNDPFGEWWYLGDKD